MKIEKIYMMLKQIKIYENQALMNNIISHQQMLLFLILIKIEDMIF